MNKNILECAVFSLLLAGNTIGTASAQNAVLSANDLFRQIYAKGKQEIVQALGPVIVISNDRITLINKGNRSEANMLPPQYHALKTVDHIALSTFMLLSDHAGVQLDKSHLEDMKSLRSAAQQARAALPATGIAPAIMKRQTDIIDDTVAFIDKVLTAGTVDAAQVTAFAKSMRQASMKNGADAVALQLSLIDTAVMTWKKTLSPAQWKDLYVIRMSSHMPRHREVTMQYFEKLLGENREGGRIIYAESIDTEARAIDLLATHIIDRRIAQAYFDSPWRMHEDLLSEVAQKYLRKHPPGR